MNRSCNEYKINLIFNKEKKTLSTYEFGTGKVFDLETITKRINIDNNIIEIDYNLEGNDFKYILEMEDL